MKKYLLVFLAFFAFSISAMAQMSDDAVVKYVQDGVKQGKQQEQLVRELVAKGVTRQQLERLKDKYESTNGKNKKKTQKASIVRRSQSEANDSTSLDPKNKKKLTKPRKNSRYNKKNDAYDEEDSEYDDEEYDNRYDEEEEEDTIKVFGRDIFKTRNLTFEPTLNVATPQNYRLGPGDEVVIEVWGASEENFTQTISPDGYINIPEVGPVSLNGLTVQAASARIKSRLAKIYAGMAAANVDISTNARVSLGQIRTIQINVMGEVANPGTYAVSSFATAFHALYKAGGVSKIGSLRKIKVVRGGRTVTVIDVYDYILRGRSNTDIRLQDGDIVLVPAYEALVRVDGKVKRPMYYEMKKGESLATLINYTGGFASDAYARSITVERNDGTEKSVATIGEMDYTEFSLKDGDWVTVSAILDRYSNRIELKGAVYRPGYYEMGSQIKTVRDLVTKADGPLEDAFLDHAVLHRENDDKTLTVISVDLKGILAQTAPDIPLHKNDVLFVPSIHDLKDQGTIEVLGEVYSPGVFPYSSNTKIEDIIIKAGGLKESASVVRVDVSRRIFDNKSTKKQKEIAQNFTFGIKDGFVIDGESGFLLQPYDQVFVRRSPGYMPQINVTVTGEVEFEGDYSLSIRNERLSDIIQKAGGLSEFAYVKGARLERFMTDDEYAQAKEMLKIIKQQNMANGDTIKISDDDISETYSVAIDLEKAMANPHTEADIALRDGDHIIIPQYNNTISVRGNVRKQNTITYDPKKSLSYYISEAGGYADHAKKSGTFIIYPNGHIKELGRLASAKVIEPGSEIIVPAKQKSQWNLGATISMVSSSASMLAVIATLISNLKK